MKICKVQLMPGAFFKDGGQPSKFITRSTNVVYEDTEGNVYNTTVTPQNHTAYGPGNIMFINGDFNVADQIRIEPNTRILFAGTNLYWNDAWGSTPSNTHVIGPGYDDDDTFLDCQGGEIQGQYYWNESEGDYGGSRGIDISFLADDAVVKNCYVDRTVFAIELHGNNTNIWIEGNRVVDTGYDSTAGWDNGGDPDGYDWENTTWISNIFGSNVMVKGHDVYFEDNEIVGDLLLGQDADWAGRNAWWNGTIHDNYISNGITQLAYQQSGFNISNNHFGGNAYVLVYGSPGNDYFYDNYNPFGDVWQLEDGTRYDLGYTLVMCIGGKGGVGNSDMEYID